MNMKGTIIENILNSGAVIQILIDKGIVTKEEFTEVKKEIDRRMKEQFPEVYK